MSEATPPPVVLGPPQRGRGIRRLGARPLYALGVVAAGFVAVAGYSIHRTHQPTAEEAPPAAPPRTGDTNTILAGMAGTGGIPAALRGGQASPPPNTPAGTLVDNPLNRDTGSAPPATTRAPAAPIDEVKQAALRDAWTRYYQDRAQFTAARHDAARSALTADTTYAASVGGGSAPGQDGQQGQAGGSNATPAAAGQPQRRGPLPGELYQGPSRAADDYLQATVTPPLSRFELKAGDPIQVRFITGISSDAPGQFRAVVSQPVFDHATGLHILIPQGAHVVGSYDHTQQIGTERLPAGATRIIFPGESSESLDLGSMPLADQAGFGGLHDQVNRHTGRLILNTLLLAVGGAGAQLTQPRGGNRGGYDASQIIAAGLGQQFGQLGNEYARRELATPPTHTIRPGYTGTLSVTQDIAFPGEWVEGVGMIPAGSAR